MPLGTRSEVVEKEIVITKLTQFYQLYCPHKIHIVPDVYDAYREKLPLLFKELLARYPTAPDSTFDDVKELLFSNQPDQIRLMSRDPIVSLEALKSLIKDGEDLIASSPPRQADLAETAREKEEKPKATLDEESLELEALVKENLLLADMVTLAEQQVFHRRLRLLFHRCKIVDRDRARLGRSADGEMTLSITHQGRTFYVGMSEGQYDYIRLGVMHMPLHAKSELAELQSSNEGSPKIEVDANAVAVAMREWSRQSPHTVTELVEGHWVFHSSNDIWWQWPKPPKATEPVAAQSMFDNSIHTQVRKAAGGTDATLLDSVLQQYGDMLPGVGFQEETVKVFGGRAFDFSRYDQHSAVASSTKTSVPDQELNKDGYWAYFLDQWDLMSEVLKGRQSPSSL